MPATARRTRTAGLQQSAFGVWSTLNIQRQADCEISMSSWEVESYFLHSLPHIRSGQTRKAAGALPLKSCRPALGCLQPGIDPSRSDMEAADGLPLSATHSPTVTSHGQPAERCGPASIAIQRGHLAPRSASQVTAVTRLSGDRSDPPVR